MGEWRTPCERDYHKSGLKRKSGSSQKVQIQLAHQVEPGWATPRASEAEHGGPNARDGSGSPHLSSQVRQAWPTPDVSSGEHPGRVAHKEGQQFQLPQAVQKAWPTPSVRDEKGANGPEHMKKERPHLGQLPNAAVYSHWMTPAAQSPNSLRGVGVHPEKRKAAGRQVNLTDQMIQFGPSSGPVSRPVPENPNTNGNPPGSLVLNADWVEELMDVPPTWTVCGSSETESIPQPPPKRSSRCTTN